MTLKVEWLYQIVVKETINGVVDKAFLSNCSYSYVRTYFIDACARQPFHLGVTEYKMTKFS